MISLEKLSLMIIVTGPRGACKSLFMTSVVCQRLLKQYFLKMLRGQESNVWTNYPVGYKFFSPIENKVVHLMSQPLNMESFYVFDEELTKGWVFIDEIDQWYDRQEWAATTQKLLNKTLTQIRKKKLSLMATTQSADWMNSRGLFQTDIIIGSREAAFSPFGRRQNLDLGECSYLSFKDKSGIMTGYTYDETGKSYSVMFWGKRFWNFYDTNYQFNPLETSVKYKLKTQTKVIDYTGGGQYPDEVDNLDPLNSNKKQRNLVLFSQLIDDYKAEGAEKVIASEFWQKATQMGFTDTLSQGGQDLMRLGVERVGRQGKFLSFEKVKEGSGIVTNPSTPKNKEKVKA